MHNNVQFHIGSRPPTQSPGSVRVVAVGGPPLAPYNVPLGDILLHTGGLTTRGIGEQIMETCEWFSMQPHPYKIFVCNPTDNFGVCKSIEILSDHTTMLLDGATTSALGLRICNPFKFENGILEFKRLYTADDIVVTSYPPAFVLDGSEPYLCSSESSKDRISSMEYSIGSKKLLYDINEHRPKLVLSGYPADQHGIIKNGGILHANSAIYGYSREDAKYIKWGVPLVFDFIK